VIVTLIEISIGEAGRDVHEGEDMFLDIGDMCESCGIGKRADGTRSAISKSGDFDFGYFLHVIRR
jgi:hypothetical protein